MIAVNNLLEAQHRLLFDAMKNKTAICPADSGRVLLRAPVRCLRSLLLAVICVACLGACDFRSSFEFWHDSDHFVDGDEFSATVSRESGVSVSSWMSHGGGYTAREQHDYWRVTWRVTELKPDMENPPTNVTYLGRYEAKRDRGSSSPASEAGLNLEMSDFTGRDHVLQWKDGRYLSPKLPITGKRADCAERRADGKTPTLLTASRRHMLVWGEPLVICDTHDLKIVREITETEAVAKLRGLYDSSMGAHHVNLTDDLRYLCVVSHNRNDHRRVWGYDIHEDRFFEKTFQFGSGNTEVVEMQSLLGRPCFLVYSDTQGMGILDEEQHVIAQFPPELTPAGGRGTFWRPGEPNVWYPLGQHHIEQKEKRIELRRFNYSDNTTAIYQLNAGELRVP